MFPFVREHLRSFLKENSSCSDLLQACDQMALDAGKENANQCFGESIGEAKTQDAIVDHVIDLMDNDVKATGLKQLQGLIWKSGFQSGEMTSHVYPDVVPALEQWAQAGIKLWIYSSGSIQAQKLFFAHTTAGDLLSMFSGHFDTTIGNKKEEASYRKIADQIQTETGITADQLLFISDVPAELDAAAAVGIETRLSIREGNAAVPEDCQHDRIESFADA